MKTWTGIGMPVLAILVGIGMLVGAVSVMRLSNIVENANSVELPITVSISTTTTTPDGDLPDYQAGDMLPGLKVDMRITYLTIEAIDAGAIIVEFSKVGIAPTDISMSWKDGNPTWTPMVWTDSGDVLKGTLGFVGSQPAGETVGYYAVLTYNTPGEYTFKVWVEGIVL
jgi:hypothetical protein